MSMGQRRQRVLVQVVIIIMAVSVSELMIMVLRYIIHQQLAHTHPILQQVFYKHHTQVDLMLSLIQIICDYIVHN